VSSNTKLCIATGIFPPDQGGPAQFANSFSSWVAKKGVDTSVVSLTDDETSHTELEDVKIDLISRRLSLPKRMFKTALCIRMKSKDSVLLINGLFLETLLGSLMKPIDYVAKVPGDIVWERARNTKRTHLNIDEFQKKVPLSLKFMRWAFVLSLKRARKIISPSTHLAGLIRGWGVDEAKITVVPNSVDSQLFKPDLEAEKLYDIITVSRLVEWKGVKELIKVAKELSLRLLVVGSGPQEEELRQIAKENDVDVVFAGEIRQSDLPSLINSSRCFVLNSKYEGSPHSLLEAMSCGALVIARSNTGTKELINSDVDGLLFDDAESLKQSIKKYLGSEAKVNEIGLRARERILNEYSREILFQRIYQLTMGIK
jgi:glycosyltransferase involved in cell wall biosynthesis